jgi:quercetin dioxygenase-like cupin family protein
MTTASTRTLWFLDSLVSVEHEPTAEAPYSLLAASARPGSTVPLHVHHDEEEIFTVLDGELTLTVGGSTATLRAGESAVAPRGVSHRFVVTSDSEARWLVLTTPGRFAAFVDEVARPAEAPVLPPAAGPPSPEQVEHLVSVAARHGIEILAP